MKQSKFYTIKSIMILSSYFFVLQLSQSYAAPQIASISGPLSHKSTLIISGNDFGTKSPVAPLVWDDCESGNVTDTWEVDPRNATSNYNMQYRTAPFRSVSSPHSHSNSRFASGGHDPSGYSPYDYSGGPNVQIHKDQSDSSATYVFYYYRVDPNWPDANNNFKNFTLSSGSFPYSGSIWYSGFSNAGMTTRYGYNPGPGFGISERYYSDSGTCNWLNCHTDYDCNRWCIYLSSDLKTWKHWEHIVDNTGGGFYHLMMDNEYIFKSVSGDPTNFSIGNVGLGGYWRKTSAEDGDENAFRYFDDIYLDTTFARVMLANNQTYENATIIEPQIPQNTWNNTTIECKVNLGKFPDSGTAYLFVFDSENNHNSTGFPVVIAGGGGDTTPPEPPTGLTILQ